MTIIANNGEIEDNENNGRLQAWLSTSEHQLVVVVFYAPWAGAYLMLKNTLSRLAKDFPRLMVENVDVEENAKMAARMHVNEVPTTFLLRHHEVVDKFEGLISRKKLENKLKSHS